MPLQMFSSRNSVNPFPQLPSTFHHFSPPSFLGHDDGDIFLHHHDLLMGHLLPANPPVAETVFNMAVSNNAATMTNQDIDRLNGEYCYGPSDFLPGKIPVKKDRHSKIHTAQGPRDRRVRLSIEIARKFFDLQDMLGFDRASKTLDWLLTKAKTAIKELTQMKYSCCGGVKSPSECETVSEINEAANHPQQLVSKRKSSVTVSKEKKMKHLRKAAFHLLARESRAMARARARERTREKMCTGRLDESKKSPNTNPSILNQLRPSSRCETCRKSDSHSHFMMSFKVAAEVEEPCPHLLANPVPREDIIEESIVIERKLKPSLIFGYQQNLVTSKDISTSNDNNDNYSPNLPQNWDISSAITPSSFCAMPNMNLWTELQIHGKPWETCNNHSI